MGRWKTWIGPYRIILSDPISYLLSFSELKELIRSDLIQVLLTPKTTQFVTCATGRKSKAALITDSLEHDRIK